MEASDTAEMAPPPSSQSHFEKFDNFVPDNTASFDNEFSRLASSQEWVGGTREYQKQRTIALRSELKLHYFSQPDELDAIDEERELTDEEKLQGYRALCEEVGIPASDSIDECKARLKSTLVNIVDLVDARRTGSKVKVWDNFEAFRKYTLKPGNMVHKEEAQKDGGILQSLLQRLITPQRGRRRGYGRRGGTARGVSGRVTKRSHAS